MIFLSGHSHWSGIKHRKAAQDAKKGVAFQKLVKDIIAAAKEGGGDPNANFRLKVAVERAKAGNVPVDNIERGIKRGTGELGGPMEEIYYEGYGPNGVAVMVQAMTDNRNRTAPDMRSLFSKSGGSIGEMGCVAWNFDRRGVVEIVGEGIDIHHLCANAKERHDKIISLLERVGLNSEHANRYPHEFSGGQRQRVAIGRAIVRDPKVCGPRVHRLRRAGLRAGRFDPGAGRQHV